MQKVKSVPKIRHKSDFYFKQTLELDTDVGAKYMGIVSKFEK